MDTIGALIFLIRNGLFDSDEEFDFSGIDFNKVYSMAAKHSVASIVALGIQKLKINIPQSIIDKFESQTRKCVLHYIQQSHAVTAITEAFEYAEIPYTLLKGDRLNSIYPSPELRTSCDINIMFDCNDSKIITIMDNLGYPCSGATSTSIGFNQSDLMKIVLYKSLFSNKYSFSDYFSTIRERLTTVKNKKFESVMSNEDFYIYLIATIAKNFMKYGSGIRSVLDIYMFNHHLPKDFDREKTDFILNSVGLQEFEQKIRSLSEKWFTGAALSESDEKLTKYIASAGIYGTHIISGINKSDIQMPRGILHAIHNVFPPYKAMCKNYDFLSGRPLLLPAYWVAYWFDPSQRSITQKRDRLHILPCPGINNDDDEFSMKLLPNLRT